MIGILLVEDHKIVRQSIRNLLESESDFKVVGEAEDGPPALLLIRELKPDIVVTDLMLGGMNGIEVIGKGKAISPGTNFIVLSIYGNEAYVIEALQAGARGYVLKESGADELAEAIREVSRGGRYLGRPLSEERLKAYIQRVTSSEISGNSSFWEI